MFLRVIQQREGSIYSNQSKREVLINLDKVFYIKPYRDGAQFFGEDDTIEYVQETFESIANKLLKKVHSN